MAGINTITTSRKRFFSSHEQHSSLKTYWCTHKIRAPEKIEQRNSWKLRDKEIETEYYLGANASRTNVSRGTNSWTVGHALFFFLPRRFRFSSEIARFRAGNCGCIVGKIDLCRGFYLLANLYSSYNILALIFSFFYFGDELFDKWKKNIREILENKKCNIKNLYIK